MARCSGTGSRPERQGHDDSPTSETAGLGAPLYCNEKGRYANDVAVPVPGAVVVTAVNAKCPGGQPVLVGYR